MPDNTLPLNTQLQADVRYRGATLPVSAWSDAVTFTTTNQSILTPTITAPLNGATGIGATPTFTSTAFATNPLGADTHASSDWQLKNSLGVVIWSSVADVVNKTSITLPSGVLAVSSQYTMEVRYNGTVLQPSQWSPVVGFTTAASFEFGKYLAYAQTVSPYIGVYGQDIDTLNKITDPAPAPTTTTNASAFSYDGAYLGIAGSPSEPLLIYKRTGDSFAKIANPSTLPIGRSYDLSFSVDGAYLAVAHNSTPFITIYKRSGDTFTKLANPAILPNGNASSVAFSPDGVYLTVAHNSTPFITIYKRSGDTFAKLANPTTLPAASAFSVAYSGDGSYMSVGGSGSPYLLTYKRSGDTFTKLAEPASLPIGTCLVSYYPPVQGI